MAECLPRVHPRAWRCHPPPLGSPPGRGGETATYIAECLPRVLPRAWRCHPSPLGSLPDPHDVTQATGTSTANMAVVKVTENRPLLRHPTRARRARNYLCLLPLAILALPVSWGLSKRRSGHPDLRADPRRRSRLPPSSRPWQDFLEGHSWCAVCSSPCLVFPDVPRCAATRHL